MKLRGPATILLSACALAGCASPAGHERMLYLEADSYGCGAAEGLGCGLALAPVLERIDGIDGVARSSASWDGRFVRIEIEPGADAARVAEVSAASLEGRAWRVGGAETRLVDAWYDAPGTVALSRHEAEVIAGGWAEGIEAELELRREDRERLVALLHEEVRAAFERAHAAGGGVHRLHAEIPESRRRLEQRVSFLAPDAQAEVLAFLECELAE